MRLALVLFVLLLLTACAGEEAPPTTTIAPTTTTTTAPPPPVTSSLSNQIVPLGSAIYDPDAIPPPAPGPVALTVDGVRVDSAPVVAVGVEANGELEIPGAREVGWYRYGPTPEQDGSTVLAAHIAYNGRDGVFRHLASIELGARITVEYDDGSTSTHVVTEIAQYAKADLPFDRVFSKTGAPMLTLITCGGSFNPSMNAYDDNVVVYAVPEG